MRRDLGTVCFLAILWPVLANVAPEARGAVISEYTAGTSLSHTAVIPGISFTTPQGENWTNLTFNWFTEDGGAVPVAFGTLFVFRAEYHGQVGDMGPSSPDFVGSAVTYNGTEYEFDHAFVLKAGTEYFFYTDEAAVLLGGGDAPSLTSYYATSLGESFVAFPGLGLNFRLSGEPDLLGTPLVPEPSTLTLAGLGGAGLFVGRLFRRRRGWCDHRPSAMRDECV